MSGPNKTLVDKIAKLFVLGNRGGAGAEAEMLSAVTKAKAMMVQHAISEHEVQAAVDKLSEKNKRPAIRVDAYTAYTRKIAKLARYDEIVAMAIGKLTDTEAVVFWTDTSTGRYTSMRFIGEETDIIVAGQLFMIFLPEVRRAARRMYGSQKWDVRHTSYAIGYASRIYDRAVQMVKDLTPQQQETMALVLYNKTEALTEYKQKHGIAVREYRRAQKLDELAHARGYEHGAQFKIDTNSLKKGNHDQETGMAADGREIYAKLRVRTPNGDGTVNYVRMAPPNYDTIQAVSVILDIRKNHVNYAGTIFKVEDIEVLPKE